MHSVFPIAIYYGPELVNIYNQSMLCTQKLSYVTIPHHHHHIVLLIFNNGFYHSVGTNTKNETPSRFGSSEVYGFRVTL